MDAGSQVRPASSAGRGRPSGGVRRIDEGDRAAACVRTGGIVARRDTTRDGASASGLVRRHRVSVR